MEAKHPVSLLQELMAKKYKQLPEYQIADVSTKGIPSFYCSIKVDNIQATAIAASKQVAKKEAALSAIKLLGYDCNKLPNDTITIVNCNAVGRLNEITAKNKLPTPTYHECGYTEDCKFKIKCNLFNDFTVGCASTKKAAKQLAAETMLKMLQEKNLAILRKVYVPDDIILKKYNELSLTNKHDESCGVLRIGKEHVPMLNETETNNNCIENNFLDHIKGQSLGHLLTLEEMSEAIKKANVTYTIDVVKRNPFVLVLTFNNNQNSTAVGTGKDYKEAHYNVLKHALKLTETIADTS